MVSDTNFRTGPRGASRKRCPTPFLRSRRFAARITMVGCLLAVVGCSDGCGRGDPAYERMEHDLIFLHDAMQRFKADCGRYPTEAEGVKALVTKPAARDVVETWRGPYLADRTHLTDYYGNPYFVGPLKHLDDDGTQIMVWCRGADGRPYTADDLAYLAGQPVLPPSEGRP